MNLDDGKTRKSDAEASGSDDVKPWNQALGYPAPAPSPWLRESGASDVVGGQRII